jgi:hypothetical protein
MPPLSVFVVVFVVIGVVLTLRRLDRPVAVVAIAGGRAKLVEGKLAPIVLDAIGTVASLAPHETGTVEVRKGRLDAKGLDEGTKQRLRNAVATMKHRI